MERQTWQRAHVGTVRPAWPAIPGRLLFGALVLAVTAAALVPWAPPSAGLVIDDITRDGSALLVSACLALAARGTSGQRRSLQAGLALGLAALAGGMTLNDLPGALPSMLVPVTTVLSVLAAAFVAGTVAIGVVRGLPRRVLVTAGLDALLLFLASVVVLSVLWVDDAAAASARPAVRTAIVAVLAWVVAMTMPLLARPVRLTLAGPLGVVLGVLLVVLSSVAWLDRITMAGTPVQAGLTDLMFPFGVVLVGWGALAWDLSPHPAPRVRAVTERLVDTFPGAAVLACVLIEIGRPLGSGTLVTGACTAAVVVIATIRQVLSRSSERSARIAGAAASDRLAAELRERADTVRSLARLERAGTLEATARSICEEAMRLDGIDAAVLSIIDAEGTITAVAAAGLDGLDLVGRPMPPERAEHVRAMASMGPWVEDFRASGVPHPEVVFESGIRATANAPLRWDNRLVGSLGLGTRSDLEAARLRERLPTVREFGVVGAALIGPMQAERERTRAAAARIDSIIARVAFMAVFQPIVDMDTGETVGFESLTRFADGTPPDVRFAEADAAGRGLELEAACLAASVEAARELPAGTWLSLNVSPALVSAPSQLGPIIAAADRRVVLEITEHVPVDDYPRLAQALRGLDGDIRLAVDDAGAGYAGLKHILEIRPHIVKLDVALVRSVDTDIARQALIGSLISFATRTDATVLAEGVETAREFESLRQMGVTLGQGYLLGRPAPAGTWQRLARDIGTGHTAGADGLPSAWGMLPFAS